MVPEDLELQNIPDDIGLDEIVGAGARLPAGRYVARLINIDGKNSESSGKPMVEVRWEIQSGEHEGEDILSWFTLHVSPPKKKGGKYFAPGLMEMKTAFAAVGADLPAGFRWPVKDVNACAKLVAKALGKKLLDIVVIEEKSKDKATGEERINSRVRVLGLAKGASKPAPVAAAADTVEDEEDLV